MEPRLRSRSFAIAIAIALLSAAVAAAPASAPRPKNVQVALRAKWPGTPLLLEASELLAKQWKDAFWEFTDLWLEPGRGGGCSSARCCLQTIVADGRSILSEQLAAVFELSLTLRSASPRLVLYRQLAEDSLSSFPVEEESVSAGRCCWVDTGNRLLFNVPELISWLESSTQRAEDALEQPEIFDFDHVYPGSKVAGPVLILYGAVGTECFKEFHLALAEASNKGKVKYIMRPVLPSGCEHASSYCSAIGASDTVNLSGYGVELALKNMEYKAMDDSAIKKGITLEDPRTEDLSQEVRGFIFSKILERKPELTDEVMGFREFLLSSTISDTLEVWELKDLGHQTVQRIVQASDPLHSMQEINQNFPTIVSSLSRMKLSDSIKDEIIANQRMVPPGKSLMALNGALINIEEIDLHMLMDLVHEELSLADQFSKMKLPQHTAQKLLSAPPPSESNSIRVDFRSSHVHYLNNLEEDAMYRRWRSNLNEILMPVFPGQLRYIRKNLFHVIYVFDPATPYGSEFIDTILSMHRNNRKVSLLSIPPSL